MEQRRAKNDRIIYGFGGDVAGIDFCAVDPKLQAFEAGGVSCGAVGGVVGKVQAVSGVGEGQPDQTFF